MMKADTTNQHSTVKVNVPIQFQSWNNQLLHASLTAITFQADDQGASAKLDMTISADTMKQLIAEQWFHAWPDALTAQAHYDKHAPIEVILELNSAIAADLAALRKDAEFLLAALLPPSTLEGSAYAGVLAHSDCWYLLEAVQTIKLPPSLKKEGTLRQGIRTIWHPSLSASTQKQRNNMSNHSVALTLIEQVEAALIGQQLQYDLYEGHIARIPFESEVTGRWLLLLEADSVLRTITAYSIFPIAIPASKQEQLALLLLHSQVDLAFGSFELDPDDQQLRFRSIIQCPNKELPVNTLQTAIGNHMALMEHYIPVIDQLITEKNDY